MTAQVGCCRSAPRGTGANERAIDQSWFALASLIARPKRIGGK